MINLYTQYIPIFHIFGLLSQSSRFFRWMHNLRRKCDFTRRDGRYGFVDGRIFGDSVASVALKSPIESDIRPPSIISSEMGKMANMIIIFDGSIL